MAQTSMRSVSPINTSLERLVVQSVLTLHMSLRQTCPWNAMIMTYKTCRQREMALKTVLLIDE